MGIALVTFLLTVTKCLLERTGEGEERGSWSEGIRSAVVGEHGCEAPVGSEGSGANVT